MDREALNRVMCVALGLVLGASCGSPLLRWAATRPCVPSVVFAGSYSRLDTLDLCGEGRIPSEPMFYGGDSFKVHCSCPMAPLEKAP